MEDPEIPLEKLHEDIHHQAEANGAPWMGLLAVTTAVLAVFAAIGGLLAGSRANEAMIKQIESSDQWNFYQAKSIKSAILDAKISLSSADATTDREKAARYLKESADIKGEAEKSSAEAKTNFHQHEVFARGVTMFQISIAIAAISALTRKRRVWYVSLAFGSAGFVFLLLGALVH